MMWTEVHVTDLLILSFLSIMASISVGVNLAASLIERRGEGGEGREERRGRDDQ